MKRHWIGGLAGLVIAFILVGCGAQGATGQVESLSPDEMRSHIEENDTAFILLNNTEDKEDRTENIELVEEKISSIDVKEINAKSSAMLDNNLKPDDLGLKDIQFGTLGIYEDGKLKDYVSLRSVDFPSEDSKEKTLQEFIDNNAS
ncbi:hypothetical protein LF817_14850 [Halobacillus sp. A1]|uniref:hypothetical protein n=1 Tax=Halobacillus sp. A1 TaxID=2880262 RepID=UPI0020A6D16E|nr:hypothetical protein [Halobacillus sp. A1]MCP3032602.1 hypothetical protein [Halobacillus sp. A1]